MVMSNFDITAFSAFRDRLFQLIEQDDLAGLLASARGEDLAKVEAGLSGKLRRFEHNKFYVAVLGEQGVGKSSLINAMLFDDEVLPVDMDETTNALCHIEHTDTEPECVLHFRDGSSKRGALDRDFLADYVDNVLNPANEKGVSEVYCYINNSNLAGGMTVTDTPGVESLTSVNVNVTYDFLPRIDAAVFLIRTNPTLTGTEAEFLRRCWRYTGRFFFVQNVMEESQQDIAIARTDNLAKIESIREQAELDATGEGSAGKINLYDVNIFDALEGACNMEPELVEESGLPILLGDVNKFLNQNPVKLKVGELAAVVLGEIQSCKKMTIGRMNNILERDKESYAEFKKKKDASVDELKSIEADWKDFKKSKDEEFATFKANLREDVQNELTKRKAKLNQVIDSGKLDKNFDKTVKAELTGLQTVMAKHEKIFQDQFIRKIQERFRDFARRLEKCTAVMSGEIGDIDQLKTVRVLGNTMKSVAYLGGTLVVGEMIYVAIAAYIAAEGWGLAAAGTAVTTGAGVAATIPVWGWIVGGALLAGGLIAAKLAKDAIKQKARVAVDNVFEDVSAKISREVIPKIETAYKGFLKELDGNLKKQTDEQRGYLEALDDDRKKSKQDSERKLEELKESMRRVEVLYAAVDDALRSTVARF
jgi:mitofusin 1